MSADAPRTVPPNMLHIDGDTLWIGKDYEHATAIFSKQPQYDGCVRVIHVDRADPQQRRCTAFLDADALAAWFARAVPPPEVEKGTT